MRGVALMRRLAPLCTSSPPQIMRIRLLSLALVALGSTAFALDGQIGIHDPSTLIQCEGKFYVYGTGGTPLVSDDGWSWRAGAVPSFTGLAPDVIRVGERYYMYV